MTLMELLPFLEPLMRLERLLFHAQRREEYR
jgi:hypothetical protein